MFSGNARTTFSLMVYIQTSLDPYNLRRALGRPCEKVLVPNHVCVRTSQRASLRVNSLINMAEQHYWHSNNDRDLSSKPWVSQSCNNIELVELKPFEYLAVELKAKLSVLIITVYHQSIHRYFCRNSQSWYHNVSPDVILNEDLNNHVNFKNNPEAMEVINLLQSFEPIQHVMEDTHGNTLDWVTTGGLNMENVSVCEIRISDHHSVSYGFTRTIA